MCGIATLFEPSAPDWLPKTIRRMMASVRHRGPDGEGFLFFEPRSGRTTPVRSSDTPADAAGEPEPPAGATLALGHRRLAIVDLTAAGHQPMADAKGECWITFNGEIYNYIELRAELAKLGHAFHTGTDTEVILAAWRQWGRDCLARFNGMFAFVIFDRRDRRLFAARDRFGVKPLYYWVTPTGGLALVSEIKQLTVHPCWSARLNGQIAYEFLNWKVCDHTSETFFAGVNQFRGGELLEATLDELGAAGARGTPLPLHRWYELTPQPFAGSFGEAGARFRELLIDSVRLRLRADVLVGTCLSGGMDSSAIVCTMRHLLGDTAAHRQKTFSAYSDVAQFDERKFAALVAGHTGADPHAVVPQPDDLLRDLPKLTWHQDEPFGSSSIYAQWCVFRLARAAGVTVMLDGQGADEALAGYHGYFGPRLGGLFARGRWSQLLRECLVLHRAYGYGWGKQAGLIANELLPLKMAEPVRRRIGRTVANPDFLNMARLGATPRWPHENSVRLREALRSVCASHLTALSLPMLLHWEDRNSMAHGIEARLPFLDYRLVEFCLGLPEDFKMADGWTKRVLREGLREMLPEPVRLRRDKLGFATAEETWMRERLRPEFASLLEKSLATAQPWLTPAAGIAARRILAGEAPFSFFVWRLISFGQWIETFHVNAAAN